MGSWLGVDRLRLVRKLVTVRENTFSDLRPKKIFIRQKGKRWRQVGGRRERAPNIKWEVLGDEGKSEEFRVKTREKFEEVEWGNGESEDMEWDKIRKLLVETADEVCGRREGKIINPWTIGREGEIELMRREVNRCVEIGERAFPRRNFPRRNIPVSYTHLTLPTKRIV